MIGSGGVPALGLMVALGLRHGLDPDHVAMIDSLVFRAVDLRSRAAPWMGSLFALGHSLAVGGVAIGVSLLAGRMHLPERLGSVVDLLVVGLLLLVGGLNLTALLRSAHYAPIGWRTALVPGRLRGSTHPLAVVGIGAAFGLMFDTATQAAAWGAAATGAGGVVDAVAIAAAFAMGMMLSDTLDSQIVGRLLRRAGQPERMRRYRRGVGWLVVMLSFAMAALELLEITGLVASFDGARVFALGAIAAVGVVAALAMGRLAGHKRIVAR